MTCEYGLSLRNLSDLENEELLQLVASIQQIGGLERRALSKTPFLNLARVITADLFYPGTISVEKGYAIALRNLEISVEGGGTQIGRQFATNRSLFPLPEATYHRGLVRHCYPALVEKIRTLFASGSAEAVCGGAECVDDDHPTLVDLEAPRGSGLTAFSYYLLAQLLDPLSHADYGLLLPRAHGELWKVERRRVLLVPLDENTAPRILWCDSEKSNLRSAHHHVPLGKCWLLLDGPGSSWFEKHEAFAFTPFAGVLRLQRSDQQSIFHKEMSNSEEQAGQRRVGNEGNKVKLSLGRWDLEDLILALFWCRRPLIKDRALLADRLRATGVCMSLTCDLELSHDSISDLIVSDLSQQIASPWMLPALSRDETSLPVYTSPYKSEHYARELVIPVSHEVNRIAANFLNAPYDKTANHADELFRRNFLQLMDQTKDQTEDHTENQSLPSVYAEEADLSPRGGERYEQLSAAEVALTASDAASMPPAHNDGSDQVPISSIVDVDTMLYPRNYPLENPMDHPIHQSMCQTMCLSPEKQVMEEWQSGDCLPIDCLLPQLTNKLPKLESNLVSTAATFRRQSAGSELTSRITLTSRRASAPYAPPPSAPPSSAARPSPPPVRVSVETEAEAEGRAEAEARVEDKAICRLRGDRRRTLSKVEVASEVVLPESGTADRRSKNAIVNVDESDQIDGTGELGLALPKGEELEERKTRETPEPVEMPVMNASCDPWEHNDKRLEVDGSEDAATAKGSRRELPSLLSFRRGENADPGGERDELRWRSDTRVRTKAATLPLYPDTPPLLSESSRPPPKAHSAEVMSYSPVSPTDPSISHSAQRKEAALVNEHQTTPPCETYGVRGDPDEAMNEGGTAGTILSDSSDVFIDNLTDILTTNFAGRLTDFGSLAENEPKVAAPLIEDEMGEGGADDTEPQSDSVGAGLDASPQEGSETNLPDKPKRLLGRRTRFPGSDSMPKRGEEVLSKESSRRPLKGAEAEGVSEGGTVLERVGHGGGERQGRQERPGEEPSSTYVEDTEKAPSTPSSSTPGTLRLEATMSRMLSPLRHGLKYESPTVVISDLSDHEGCLVPDSETEAENAASPRPFSRRPSRGSSRPSSRASSRASLRSSSSLALSRTSSRKSKQSHGQQKSGHKTHHEPGPKAARGPRPLAARIDGVDPDQACARSSVKDERESIGEGMQGTSEKAITRFPPLPCRLDEGFVPIEKNGNVNSCASIAAPQQALDSRRQSLTPKDEDALRSAAPHPPTPAQTPGQTLPHVTGAAAAAPTNSREAADKRRPSKGTGRRCTRQQKRGSACLSVSPGSLGPNDGSLHGSPANDGASPAEEDAKRRKVTPRARAAPAANATSAATATPTVRATPAVRSTMILSPRRLRQSTLLTLGRPIAGSEGEHYPTSTGDQVPSTDAKADAEDETEAEVRGGIELGKVELASGMPSMAVAVTAGDEGCFDGGRGRSRCARKAAGAVATSDMVGTQEANGDADTERRTSVRGRSLEKRFSVTDRGSLGEGGADTGHDDLEANVEAHDSRAGKLKETWECSSVEQGTTGRLDMVVARRAENRVRRKSQQGQRKKDSNNRGHSGNTTGGFTAELLSDDGDSFLKVFEKEKENIEALPDKWSSLQQDITMLKMQKEQAAQTIRVCDLRLNQIRQLLYAIEEP